MSIFEENCRRTYNEMRYEMITEESDSESHYWGDDEDLKDAMDYMSPRERRNALDAAGLDEDDLDEEDDLDISDDFDDDFDDDSDDYSAYHDDFERDFDDDFGDNFGDDF